MEFGEWSIYYKEILDDFGFSREDDEKSAQLLDEILSQEGCLTLEDLSKIVGFSDKFILCIISFCEQIRVIQNKYIAVFFGIHILKYRRYQS